MEAVISALTIIEAVPARTHKARLNWVLSGLRVVPVGEEEARAASRLRHRRHGQALRRSCPACGGVKNRERERSCRGRPTGPAECSTLVQ